MDFLKNPLLIIKFSDMYKKLRETEGERNVDRVNLIKEVLNRMKKSLKMCLKIEHL